MRRLTFEPRHANNKSPAHPYSPTPALPRLPFTLSLLLPLLTGTGTSTGHGTTLACSKLAKSNSAAAINVAWLQGNLLRASPEAKAAPKQSANQPQTSQRSINAATVPRKLVACSIVFMWVWLKIKQEGLCRFWSMFPLTRVPFWVPVF